MTRILFCADCGASFDYPGIGQPAKYCDEHKRSGGRNKPGSYNANQTRARNLMFRYGITLEEYEAILDAQGGVCAVCGRPPAKGRNLAVDHSHKYGFVRGLLCTMPCNRHLISRNNDPELFERAAAYLRRPPAKAVLPGRLVAPTRRNGKPWDEWPGDVP